MIIVNLLKFHWQICQLVTAGVVLFLKHVLQSAPHAIFVSLSCLLVAVKVGARRGQQRVLCCCGGLPSQPRENGMLRSPRARLTAKQPTTTDNK